MADLTIIVSGTPVPVHLAPAPDAVLDAAALAAIALKVDFADLAADEGAGLSGFSHAETYGAGTVGRHLKGRVYVTDAPYNATGDGVTDDSTAIMAAIDANKGGTVILPGGYTFNAAGIALSGSTYNGTTLIIEGTLLFKDLNGTPNWDAGVSPSMVAIILHDVENVTVDVPGVIDGNRANQADDEQHYCLLLRGARNIRIPRFNTKEIRGDGIAITSKTNVTPLTTNSSNVHIGSLTAINSAYDGRNALSIISCSGCVVDSIYSDKVGEVINAVRMPGGVDIEPDGAWHDVEDIVIGPAYVDTQGTSGVAALGVSITGNDATEDWNVRNVTFAGFRVVNDGGHGGGNFRRVEDLDIKGHVRHTSRGTAFSIDFINGLTADIQAQDVAIGAVLGLDGYVRDFELALRVDNHNAAACVVYGLDDGKLRLRTRAPQGAGSYGLSLAHTGSGARAITLTNVVFDVDIPAVVGSISGAIIVAADGGGGSIAFGVGTVVTGSMAGWIGTAIADLQFITRAIPSRNVEGRHFRTAVPTTGDGLWLVGEVIWDTDAAAGAAPGWVCTTGGTAGTTAVFKAMASLAA